MHPTLIAIGPISIKVFNLFLVFGFLVTAFIFWRRTKEEHYQEGELFDGFLLAVLVGFVAGRIGFVLGHFNEFGFDFPKWLNIFSFGGFSGLLGLIAATFYLALFAKRKHWDVFSILDHWVTSLSLGVGIIYLGLFFDSAGSGLATSLPWGITFPGQLEPHHPVQLYWAGFFFLLFAFLSWVEYRYRTFTWYRAGKKAAQTGFLTASFLIFLGLFSFLMIFVTAPQLTFKGVRLDYWLSGFTFISGLVLMAIRSNRFQLRKKKPPAIYAQK